MGILKKTGAGTLSPKTAFFPAVTSLRPHVQVPERDPAPEQGFNSNLCKFTLMEISLINDDVLLGLLVMAVFIVAIIAFWPLMPVFIWAIAIAAALLPVHQRLSRIVKPSVSATFITIWVLLLILLVASLAAFLLINNEEHLGDMTLNMVNGLKHTSLSGFVPSFSECTALQF